VAELGRHALNRALVGAVVCPHAVVPPKKRAPRWSPWPTVGTRGGAVGTQRSWNLAAARRVEQSRPTTGLGGETVLTSGQRGERGEAVAWDRMGAGEAGRVNRSGPLGK
jgi:hypothetical protein